MTDLIGPASSLNAVQNRPSDGRNFGALDTFFRDCTTPASQDGTQVTAGWLNQVTGLFRAAIRGNGNRAGGTTPVVAEDQGDLMLLTSINQLILRGQATYGVDTGSADALVVTPIAGPAVEYKAGMVLGVMKGANPNATAAPSLNLSGLGAVTIVRKDGSAVAAGDLPAGALFYAWYDGAKFRLTSFSRSDIAAIVAAYIPATGTAPVCYVADAGTADALAGPGSPTIGAYTVGQAFLIAKSNTANATTTPTLQVGNLATVTIVKRDGSPLAVGDLPAKATFWAEYDGTNIRYVGPTVSDIAAAVAAYASAFVVGAADGQCRLSLFNPTTSNGATTSQTLQMLPFAGNALVINGVPQAIPAGGVKLSYIVNNQLQPASTVLYIYAYMAGTVMTLEASATGYTVDSFGRANKTGDATRRLVGAVYTTAASLFRSDAQWIGVSNYFNRQALAIDATITNQTVAINTDVPIDNAVPFYGWAGDRTDLHTICLSSTGAVQAKSNLDGNAVGNFSFSTYPVSSGFAQSSNTATGAMSRFEGVLSEGLHIAQGVVQVGAAAGGQTTGTIAIARHYGFIRG